MQYDEELDKVVRSQFYFEFGVNCPDLQDLAGMLTMDNISVEGNAEGDFILDCDYSDRFHKLEGNGHFIFRDTQLTGFPVGRVRKVKTPVEIRFDTLDGDVILEKEQIRVDNVTCRGRWLDFELDGRMGFLDKEISIDGNMAVVPEAIRESRLFRILPGWRNISKQRNLS